MGILAWMSVPPADALLRRLRRPRYQILLGLLLLAVGLRVALPYLLRPQIVSRADAALVGRIALADLDLSLFRGGVTLHGLEVYADELPASGARSEPQASGGGGAGYARAVPARPASGARSEPQASEVHQAEAAPAPEAAPPAEMKPPLFEARRLWTQISWLALLGKTIEVEELDLDGFVVRLDRLKDGILLPKPVPSQEPEKTEPDQPLGWSFAAESVGLRDGKIFFRDFTVGEEPQRFDLAIKDISAEDLALVVDPAGREPGHLALSAEIGEGRLGLDSQIESKPGGAAAVSKIALANLPVGGMRLYLARFGWSELTGKLDANLEHRFETGGVHQLGGQLSLREIVVQVPELDRPALSWKNLGIRIEKVDLVEQRAEVGEVALEGAHVVVAPKASPALPLITPPASAQTAAETKDKARKVAKSAAEALEIEPEKPWSWRVAKVGVADSSIDVMGSGQMLPLAFQARLRDLASEPGGKAPLEISLNSEKGSLALNGELGLTPLAFDGKLRIVDFALPPLLGYLDAPGVGLLRRGVARADLQIALAPGAAAGGQPAPTDLRVEGSIGLGGLDVGEPLTDKDFGATWKDLEVEIRELSVPALIGGSGSDAPQAMVVNLEHVRLREPAFKVTRVREGILLPALGEAPPPAEAKQRAAAQTAQTAPAAPEAAPAGTAPAGAEQEIRVEIGEARVEGGRAQIVDRTVQPFYRTRIDDLDLKARGVRWPGPVVKDLVLAMRGMQGAKLDVKGSLAPGNSNVDLKLVQLPLAPFNAYVTPRGYSLAGGTLSFDTQGKFQRGAYDTSSKVLISQLDVAGSQGEALFQENFGIPLSVALGLLKDLNGDIHLAVPVAGDPGGARVGVAALIRQALSKALVGALASPLKLFGAVTEGGRVQSLAPEPIAFAAGSTQISEEGKARLEQLAGLLSASPGVALTLRGATSPEDERWLKEQALLEELRATSGLRSLRKLGEIGTRAAVRDHLEARFAGRESPLEPEAQTWLEAQVALKSADPNELAALADARAAAARQALASEYGIDPARLSIGPPESAAPTAVPGVLIALGATPRASP
jgi:hypothetical protein